MKKYRSGREGKTGRENAGGGLRRIGGCLLGTLREQTRRGGAVFSPWKQVSYGRSITHVKMLLQSPLYARRSLHPAATPSPKRPKTALTHAPAATTNSYPPTAPTHFLLQQQHRSSSPLFVGAHDGGSQAVLGLVRRRQGLLFVLELPDAQHRPEDLRGPRLIRLLHAGQHGGQHVVTLPGGSAGGGGGVVGGGASTAENLRAGLDRLLDKRPQRDIGNSG